MFATIETMLQQVEDAIENNKLSNYLDKSNNQINGIVELVRGNLSPGATITIEALVVLDVHGILFKLKLFI